MNQNKNLLKSLILLDNLNKKFSSNRLRIISSKRVHRSNFNFFRYVCSDVEFRKSPYSEILINYLNKSEKYYPGSSFFLSSYIVEMILRKNNIFNNIKKISKTKENLYKYFSQISTKDSFNLIKNILEFSGPDATLICNPSDANEIIVKKNKNPLFNVSIHKEFENIYFNKSKSKTQTYLISVMDVYIERESELVPLIDKAKDINAPLLVFCRGISSNSVKALKNIILRNNIHILPYIVKFENEDPFKLEDLSKVLRCDLINLESGDGIYKNSVNKSSTGTLKLSRDKIEIFDPDTSLSNTINEKLKSCFDLSLKEYLIKRKSRINSNVIEILIPNNKIEMLYEIKCLIVCYNNISKYGLYKIENNINSFKCVEMVNFLGDKLIKTLSSIGYVVSHKENKNII